MPESTVRPPPPSPGRLRLYLGAAPGVGKTYAMLDEAHRRLERGTDVVVGLVETHGRIQTAERLDRLPVVPRRQVAYHGTTLADLDVDAVLARRPQLVLVDELAHTNAPGARHGKRWEDVDELLEAGIDVLSTLNVQHLESLGDVVNAITGIRQQETVPDQVVRRADQIELVDMTPEALRRRLAHGNVYAPDKVDAALANYFRPGNLAALRELALLWLADRVDEGLERYRRAHGISTSWPARDRIVVAVTGGAESETLLRRGARLAASGAGGEVHALYVARNDGLAAGSLADVSELRQLTEDLAGTFHTVLGDDVAATVLDFARSVNASQIVIGISRHGRGLASLRRGIGDAIVAGSGDIDVHVVSHAYRGRRQLRRTDPGLSHRRLLAGWLLATAGAGALTAVLVATAALHGLATETMLYLALAVVCALVGGRWPGIAAALVGGVLLNFFLTPPVHTMTIGSPENLFAVLVFVILAIAVASVVDLAARRTAQAARARSEADALTALAQTVLRPGDVTAQVLEQIQETFGATGVTVFERDGSRWRATHSAGTASARLDDAPTTVTVSDSLRIAVAGPLLTTEDTRVLSAFGSQLAAVLDRDALAREAARSHQLQQGNEIRTALLGAVSHDLRTPLAAVKAAATSLAQPNLRFSAADEAELIATIIDATDRLESLVADLLDMSRLQTGAVTPLERAVDAADLVALVLAGLPDGAPVRVDVPADLPVLTTDPGLLERVLANVVGNALGHGGGPVLVLASALGDRIQVRVVDRGPGVPPNRRDAMFAPFQRVGDVPGGDGLGLGLAVARGLTEAMGGTLLAEDTPGGGLTMVLDLPVGDPPPPPEPPAQLQASR